ncbi:MAG: hypothetical protein K2H56_02825 [Malacoplasma sp.]|nr:hypothetical protein [Malacoplasma sp.]
MNKVFLIFNNVCAAAISIFGIVTIGTTINLYNNYNLAKDEYDFYHSYNQSNNKDLIKEDLENLINLKYKNVSDNTYYLSLNEITEKTQNTLKDFLNFLKNKENLNSIIFNKNINNEIQNNINSDNSEFYVSLDSFKQKINSLKDKENDFYNQCLRFSSTVTKNYYYDATPENVSFIAGLCLLLVGIVWWIIYWSIFVFKKIKGQKNKK